MITAFYTNLLKLKQICNQNSKGINYTKCASSFYTEKQQN